MPGASRDRLVAAGGGWPGNMVHPLEPQPPGPGSHPGDLHEEAGKGPTLTGEELLDAREAAARPTSEDADYDPGEARDDDQGHDAEGAWRRDRHRRGHLRGQ